MVPNERIFLLYKLSIREAFFNFLFHVVSGCSKRTGGRATNSKLKTQNHFSSRRKKKKESEKIEHPAGIEFVSSACELSALDRSAIEICAHVHRPNSSVPDSLFECLRQQKQGKMMSLAGLEPGTYRLTADRSAN